jgi:hypothetical protein
MAKIRLLSLPKDRLRRYIPFAVQQELLFHAFGVFLKRLHADQLLRSLTLFGPLIQEYIRKLFLAWFRECTGRYIYCPMPWTTKKGTESEVVLGDKQYTVRPPGKLHTNI